MDNQDRAHIGEDAICLAFPEYNAEEIEEHGLIDLLADLMHYAHQQGQSFTEAVRSAASHYNEELLEEQHTL